MSDQVLAVDVGGTSIKAALIDGTGEIAHRWRESTGADNGPASVVRHVVESCGRWAAEASELTGAPIAAIGLAVPGNVDEASGIAVDSSNIGWRDVPFVRLVSEATGLPCVLVHDVRAGGIAEAERGAGRGESDFAFVAIGTGISAALFVDGVLLRGAYGRAGELGHVNVRRDGEPCPCGRRGCLERYASASAIARAYAAAPGVPMLSAKNVAELVERGDRAAARVWGDAVDALAYGLHQLHVLCNPRTIVIGGGLSRAGDTLVHPLRAALAQQTPEPPLLVVGQFLDEAGIVGAGLAARAWR